MKAINIQLQLEAGALFALSLFLYHKVGADWTNFALYFFLPDITILLYLHSAKAGAWAYNCSHFYAWPFLLFAAGAGINAHYYTPALIWLAHLSFDRMLGWGLSISHITANSRSRQRLILFVSNCFIFGLI